MLKYIIQLFLVVAVTSVYAKDEERKVIYITPGYWGDLFDEKNPQVNRDDCLAPMCRLREKALEKGFDVKMANPFKELKDFEYLIVFEVFPDQIKAVSKYPKEKLVLFLWEPPSVLPDNYKPEFHENFSRVYTWHDTLVDNKKYFKFHYPVFHQMIEDAVPYEKKKLATLISCNKHSQDLNELYSQRRKVIEYYERQQNPSFDLYGKWWPHELKVYKGAVDKKVDVLKIYRFNYAYENIKDLSGYVTEKIFDTFQAGTVPIYWGASNVNDYIPADCFIDRRKFKNEEEVAEFIKTISKDEYEKYISNINNFMKSEKKNPYTIDFFVDFMINLFETTNSQSTNYNYENSQELYSDIKDVTHPADEDYLKIQKYLENGSRKEIEALGSYYESLARDLKITPNNTQEKISSHVVTLGTTKEEKKNCVITYASFNKNYPNSLLKLVQNITESDFKGDILYRIGGWPNVEQGSLVLAHVPYAFKASLFKEAESKGYERILWLDSSMTPLVNLNAVFDEIASKGYFVMGNSHMVGPYFNENAAKSFDVSMETAYNVPSCSAGIFGLDLTNEKAKKVLERWYDLAFDPHAYYSSRPEQNALSVILYQAGIHDFTPLSRLAHGREEINPDSLFLLDWHFAHQ